MTYTLTRPDQTRPAQLNPTFTNFSQRANHPIHGQVSKKRQGGRDLGDGVQHRRRWASGVSKLGVCGKFCIHSFERCGSVVGVVGEREREGEGGGWDGGVVSRLMLQKEVYGVWLYGKRRYEC